MPKKKVKMDGRYVAAIRDVLSQGGRLHGNKKARQKYIEYDGEKYAILPDGKILINGKPKSARLLLPKYSHLTSPQERHPAIRRLGRKQQGLMAYIRTATNNGEYLVGELLRIVFRKRTEDKDRIKAIEILLNRGWGQAPQHVQVDGNVGITTITQVMRDAISDPKSQRALELIAVRILESQPDDSGDEAEQRIVEASPALESPIGRDNVSSNGTGAEVDSGDAPEAWEE